MIKKKWKTFWLTEPLTAIFAGAVVIPTLATIGSWMVRPDYQSMKVTLGEGKAE